MQKHRYQAHSQDFQKEGHMDVESVCMHNCIGLGGSGGMFPQEIFRNYMLLGCF